MPYEDSGYRGRGPRAAVPRRGVTQYVSRWARPIPVMKLLWNVVMPLVSIGAEACRSFGTITTGSTRLKVVAPTSTVCFSVTLMIVPRSSPRWFESGHC